MHRTVKINDVYRSMSVHSLPLCTSWRDTCFDPRVSCDPILEFLWMGEMRDAESPKVLGGACPFLSFFSYVGRACVGTNTVAMGHYLVSILYLCHTRRPSSFDVLSTTLVKLIPLAHGGGDFELAGSKSSIQWILLKCTIGFMDLIS